MTPEFRSAIFSWKYDEVKDGPMDTCIPLQLQKLFGYLQLSNQKSADTVGLTTSFGWTGRDVFQQQDVQELFRVLFDALEDAFKDTSLGNIIDQIYAGEMIDYVRCIDIDYESERADKFLDLSFAIIPFGKKKSLSSLNQCIKMYLRPEILDGDNQYYAEPVERKVDAIKGIKVRRLPYVMAIHLKRFVFDFTGDNVVQKKINDVVKFPMVLDMNRYVSKKRRAESLVAEEDDDDDAADQEHRRQINHDEFEEFLQEQITILREHASLRDEKNTTKNHSGGHSNDQEDVDEEEEDLDAIEHVPDLVDSLGKKSPDQLLEETKIKEMELLETTCFATREELLQLVDTRGEWIYELYAVLIHSGAITGGHYYAYIKDLSSMKWYNFNDSHVSEIQEKDVQEAWGKVLYTSTGSTHSYNAQSSYSSWYDINSYGSASYGSSNYKAKTSTTTFSGANAYMLMYRKVSRDPCLETGAVGISNEFPSDAMIPDYIHEAVKRESEEYQAKLKEEEERRKQLSVTIYWKRELNYIQMKSSDRLTALLDKLWKRFNLIYEPEFEDILAKAKAKHPPAPDVDGDLLSEDIEVPCPYDRIRLRSYLHTSGIKYEAHEVTGASDERTLQDHGIGAYRQYIFEIRSLDEEFEEYIQGGINLNIYLYRKEIKSFSEPVQLNVKPNSSLIDLKMKIHAIFSKKKLMNYPIEQMRLMRPQRSYNMRPSTIDILDNNQLALSEGYRISYQDKIYVEERESNSTQPIASSPSISYGFADIDLDAESEAYRVLYNSLFELKIMHNIPYKTHPCYENNAMTTPMIVDSRWTVTKLREEMANVLNSARLSLPAAGDGLMEEDDPVAVVLDKSRIRMFLHYADGREFRNDGELRQEGVYDNCKVFVSIGYVAPPNHFVLRFNLYAPRCHDGLTRREQYVHSLHFINQTYLASASESSSTLPIEEEMVNIDLENQQQQPEHQHQPVQESIVDKFSAKIAQQETKYRQHDASDVAGYDGGDSENDSSDSIVDGLSNIKITKQKTPLTGKKASPSSSILPSNENTSSQIEPPNDDSDRLDRVPPIDDSWTPVKVDEEIQPSNFAAVVISNDVDKAELVNIPIDSIFACDDSLVDTIRQELAAKLSPIISKLLQSDFLEAFGLQSFSSSSTGSIEIPFHRIRIRESQENVPGKIIRDGATFRQQGVYVTSNKTWMVQILSEAEAKHDTSLHPIDGDDVQVTVMKWQRPTWSLSEKIEYVFRGELRVQEVCQQLAIIYGIRPVSNMHMLLIKSYNKVHLSDLNQHMLRELYRSWTNHSSDTRRLKDLSNLDFKLRHGDIILLQDITEPLKELTPQDRLSLQYVEEASRSIYGTGNYHGYGGRYDPVYSYAPTSVTSSNDPLTSPIKGKTSSHSPVVGIKIKTQKDRLKQSAVDANGITSPTNELSGNKNNTEHQLPSTVITDESMQEAFQCADDAEFNKQGGVALFADLAEL
jgi:hypothetical protein